MSKGRNKQSNKRVGLELTQPKKEKNEWAVRAIATVTEGNKTPKDQKVVFFLEGHLSGEGMTNDEGRVYVDLVLPKPGKYLVEAKISGTQLVSRKTVEIPGESPKEQQPLRIQVQEVRHGREFELHCQVLQFKGGANNQGSPMKKASVVLFNEDQEPKRRRTNDQGVVIFKVTLKSWERKRLITLSVEGTSTTQAVHLFQEVNISSWDESHSSTF